MAEVIPFRLVGPREGGEAVPEAGTVLEWVKV